MGSFLLYQLGRRNFMLNNFTYLDYTYFTICYYIYSFLNILLLYFQNMGLGFLSSAIFSIFCLYLLWATIKGNLKFGVRVMCCFDTHPMK